MEFKANDDPDYTPVSFKVIYELIKAVLNMLFDLHVHTNKHSFCGQASPEQMAQRAVEVGLDGIVITEHDYCWTPEEIEELHLKFPDLIILRGAEVNVDPYGHHVLVYGVTDLLLQDRYPDVSEYVDYIHRSNGAVIWAHPIRYTYKPHSRYFQVGFDGIETKAINIDFDDWKAASELAAELDIPEVYSSDAHNTVSMGPFICDFHVPIKNESDLAQAIRKREFHPILQKEWLDEALKEKGSILDNSIQKLIDRGITDCLEIKRKNGASVVRIKRALESR
jgi:hypothetical protein